MTRRVGIEVSATAVRVAELEPGPRARLVAFAERELPRGVVVDGAVRDTEAVKEALTSCLAIGHFRRRRRGGHVSAHLAIAGLRTITREFELPRLDDSELEAAARLQALDIVPFAVEEAVLSVRRLGPVEGSDPPRDRVLLAAAHRDLVEPLVAATEAAGVVILGVDFAPFAIVRALSDLTKEGAEAIVSIGADLTTVVIHDRGEPLLVRTIAGGGQSVTRAISAALDLPIADAEAMKLNLAAEMPRVPAEATAAARDASMALISEIRSTLQYYAGIPGGGECRSVILTGGGTLLSGFEERLSQQLAPPVFRRGLLEPFALRNVSDESDRDLDAFRAVVIGAALPPVPGARTIELLPPEVRARRRERAIVHRLVAAAVVIATALAVLGGLRYVQVYQARQAVTTLQRSISLLEGQIPKYYAVETMHEQILTDSAMAEPLVSNEVDWPAVVGAINTYTPSSVSASDLSGQTTAATSKRSTSLLASSVVLPSPDAVIGTVNLTLTGTSYVAFQQWFNSIAASGDLSINNFSGINSSKTGITFSAQLAIEGAIHTDRLTRFEVAGS